MIRISKTRKYSLMQCKLIVPAKFYYILASNNFFKNFIFNGVNVVH